MDSGIVRLVLLGEHFLPYNGFELAKHSQILYFILSTFQVDYLQIFSKHYF